jgi:hypothetical protein
MEEDFWRTIKEFPDYAVSRDGQVKRIASERRWLIGKILKPYLAKYVQLTLYIAKEPYAVQVHRIVCKTFHGDPPSPEYEVAHGDGDRWNNHWENLKWSTHAENEADKIAHGTSLAGRKSSVPLERRASGRTHGRHTKPERTARGERTGTSKLNEENVVKIRADNRPMKQIAASYGITSTMVGYIKSGKSWAHVPMNNGTEMVL